jgi:hypothetical protein
MAPARARARPASISETVSLVFYLDIQCLGVGLARVSTLDDSCNIYVVFECHVAVLEIHLSI